MPDYLTSITLGGAVVFLIIFAVLDLILVVAPLIQIVQLRGIRKALDSLQQSNAQLLAQIYQNPNRPQD